MNDQRRARKSVGSKQPMIVQHDHGPRGGANLDGLADSGSF